MDYDNLFKSLTGLGAGISAVAASWKWLPALVVKIRARGMVAGLQRLHTVHNTMAGAVECGATRTVIFGGHNSGGIPRVGSPFYVSALHCHVEGDRGSQIADYQSINVDAAYIELLLQVVSKGFTRFDCSSTALPCMLLRFYRSEGVTDSLICYLGTTDGNLIYVSFARFEGCFTENEETRLRLIANQISQLIK